MATHIDPFAPGNSPQHPANWRPTEDGHIQHGWVPVPSAQDDPTASNPAVPGPQATDTSDDPLAAALAALDAAKGH